MSEDSTEYGGGVQPELGIKTVFRVDVPYGLSVRLEKCFGQYGIAAIGPDGGARISLTRDHLVAFANAMLEAAHEPTPSFAMKPDDPVVVDTEPHT